MDGDEREVTSDLRICSIDGEVRRLSLLIIDFSDRRLRGRLRSNEQQLMAIRQRISTIRLRMLPVKKRDLTRRIVSESGTVSENRTRCRSLTLLPSNDIVVARLTLIAEVVVVASEKEKKKVRCSTRSHDLQARPLTIDQYAMAPAMAELQIRARGIAARVIDALSLIDIEVDAGHGMIDGVLSI